MLSAENRLRRDRDFRRVYAAKRSFVHPLMVLYTRPSAQGQRIGFSVSKKLGGAVRRNRIKRRLREAFRAHGPVLSGRFDAIIVARSRIGNATYAEITETVSTLFRRAGLIEPLGISRQSDRDGRSVEGDHPNVSGDREGEP